MGRFEWGQEVYVEKVYVLLTSLRNRCCQVDLVVNMTADVESHVDVLPAVLAAYL